MQFKTEFNRLLQINSINNVKKLFQSILNAV